MPLLTFDSQDAIPEAQRATALALVDGKFAVFEDVDTTALTSAVEEERRLRKAAELATAKALREAKARETSDKAKEHGVDGARLKEIEDAIGAAKDADYAPKLAKLTSLEAKVRDLTLVNQVKSAASEFGKILPHRTADFWKLYGDEFDVTDDDKVIVKANPGIPIKQRIEELAALQKDWQQGSLGEGGGARGTSTTPITTTGGAIDITNATALLQAGFAQNKK